MINPPNIIVIDLDGTLCDNRQREHLAVAKLWDDFHAGIPDDAPHEDVRWLMDQLSCILYNNIQLVALTGRPEKHRKPTLEWMARHNVMVDELIMRPDNDWSPDHELKPRLLAAAFPKEQVRFILDDRDRVVEGWRNAGYNCWQVRPGGY
jgi:hypothetical protein